MDAGSYAKDIIHQKVSKIITDIPLISSLNHSISKFIWSPENGLNRIVNESTEFTLTDHMKNSYSDL